MAPRPVIVRNRSASSPVVLTCEHASHQLPPEYGSLGLAPSALADHIGWDIGAAAVSRLLASAFDAPLVESAYSRLLIDCNRDTVDHDLIAETSHGVEVPGNRELRQEERERRLRGVYAPYHDAVDEVLAGRSRGTLLLSLHSFTPALGGQTRDFDLGVLYDDHRDPAGRLFEALEAEAFAVRHNQPYSGLDGLIHSARTHGQRHGITYLELEINNGLLRRGERIAEVAGRIAAALRRVL